MRSFPMMALWLGCTTVNVQNPPPATPAPSSAASAAPSSSPTTADPPVYKQAAADTAKTDCKTLVQVVETWKLNHPGPLTKCPTTDDLKNDKALKSDQNVSDPWGTAYKIVCTGDEFGVASAGPDRQWESADDIWAGTKPPSATTPKKK